MIVEEENNDSTFDFKKPFTKKVIQIDSNTAVYELKYFESGLWKEVEELLEEETIVGGTIKVRRKYVTTRVNHGKEHITKDKMFTFHTNVRDTSIKDTELRATMAIVHGFAESSDIHLESAI